MTTFFTAAPTSPESTATTAYLPSPALIALDWGEARVFRALAPGTEPVLVFTPATQGSAVPLPFGGLRHAPDPDYFEAIAQALGEPGPIQVIGCGPDSVAMTKALLAWLETCRPTLAANVVNTSFTPDHFCSDKRLLTAARNFLANQAYALCAS